MRMKEWKPAGYVTDRALQLDLLRRMQAVYPDRLSEESVLTVEAYSRSAVQPVNDGVAHLRCSRDQLGPGHRDAVMVTIRPPHYGRPWVMY